MWEFKLGIILEFFIFPLNRVWKRDLRKERRVRFQEINDSLVNKTILWFDNDVIEYQDE